MLDRKLPGQTPLDVAAQVAWVAPRGTDEVRRLECADKQQAPAIRRRSIQSLTGINSSDRGDEHDGVSSTGVIESSNKHNARRKRGRMRASRSIGEIPPIDPDSKVALPAKYRNLVTDDVKEIRAGDLTFFEGLLDKYGIAEARERGGKTKTEFGEAEFFIAASDIAEYALALRARTMPHWNKGQNSALGPTEIFHPTSMRLEDLCTLFFHQRRIKSAYMQVQHRKMELALSDFMSSMADYRQALSKLSSRNDYFTFAKNLMSESMEKASHNFTPAQVDTLGILLGFYERGILLTEQHERRSIFSNIGNGTFIEFLEDIVNDAVHNGQNMQSAVRRELLESDGTGFTLMRTHLKNFGRRKRLFKSFHSVEKARAKLSSDTYTKGACPAILKTDSLDGSGTRRPIVYEYASFIVDNIPEHLVKEAA